MAPPSLKSSRGICEPGRRLLKRIESEIVGRAEGQAIEIALTNS
jgi:hypothetical protein